MKNIIFIVVLMLSFTLHSQDSFKVSGTLLNSNQNTTVIIYIPDTEGNWQYKDTIYGEDMYQLEVSTNEAYLLRFINPLGDKYLWLDLDNHSGFYTMNVNFEYTTHGVVYYNDEFSQYMSYLVTNDEVQNLFDNH